MSNTNYIYVGQYEGVTLTSKLIKWFTWSRISHTSAVLINKNEVIEAWKDGVVRRSMNDGHEPGTIIHIYRIPCTLSQRNSFYNFLESHVGQMKYDFMGILGILLRSKLESADRAFCSALIFSGLYKVGLVMLNNIGSHQVTPGIFDLSPLLEYVETRTL